jgi:hypothetical protein
MISKMTRVLFVCLFAISVHCLASLSMGAACPKVKPADARCDLTMPATFGSCAQTSGNAPCAARNITTNHVGKFTTELNGNSETNVTVNAGVSPVECLTVLWCQLDEDSNICKTKPPESAVVHKTFSLKVVDCVN